MNNNHHKLRRKYPPSPLPIQLVVVIAAIAFVIVALINYHQTRDPAWLTWAATIFCAVITAVLVFKR